MANDYAVFIASAVFFLLGCATTYFKEVCETHATLFDLPACPPVPTPEQGKPFGYYNELAAVSGLPCLLQETITQAQNTPRQQEALYHERELDKLLRCSYVQAYQNTENDVTQATKFYCHRIGGMRWDSTIGVRWSLSYHVRELFAERYAGHYTTYQQECILAAVLDYVHAILEPRTNETQKMFTNDDSKLLHPGEGNS